MMDYIEKEKVGTIHLSDKVKVSDPCYAADVWCAGVIENVLSGEYECYTQKADNGVRIACIEVRHKDFLDIDPIEVQDINVGVDSGQCGIYDLPYFVKAREDKGGEDAWYHRVCNETYKYVENPNYVEFEDSEFWKDEYQAYAQFKDASGLDELDDLKITLKRLNDEELTEKEKQYVELEEKFGKIRSDYSESYMKYYEKYKYVHSHLGKFCAVTLDDKCIVSSSGYGDGIYTCLVGRSIDGNVVSIKVDYFYGYGDDEE